MSYIFQNLKSQNIGLFLHTPVHIQTSTWAFVPLEAVSACSSCLFKGILQCHGKWEPSILWFFFFKKICLFVSTSKKANTTEALGKSNLQRTWRYKQSTWTIHSVRWSLPINFELWKKEAGTSVGVKEEAAKSSGTVTEKQNPVALVEWCLVHNTSTYKHCWDSVCVLSVGVECKSYNERIFCNAGTSYVLLLPRVLHKLPRVKGSHLLILLS